MKYQVHRNGHGELQDHLRMSLQQFYRTHGRLPIRIVVAPKGQDDATAALEALRLPQIEVGTTGGCLLGEVWLGIEEEETDGNDND